MRAVRCRPLSLGVHWSGSALHSHSRARSRGSPTATPDAVLADFDGVELEARGQRTRLSRRGDEFWVELPDPLWLLDPDPDKPARAPTIEVRAVMTTGSHHLQNFWFRRPATGEVYGDSHDNGALVQVPWVWLVDEGRWVPAQESFLTPPSPRIDPPLVWNTSCFECHSVATEPRFADDAFDSRSVELGVACEACHGPATEHVRANRSPLRRYARYLTNGSSGDPTIVLPSRLDRERSAEVCGQCHSFHRTVDMDRLKSTGVAYRPGDDLDETKAVLRYEAPPRHPQLLRQLEEEPNALDGRYWADGTIRVAGREYNGLVESGCFQRGEMTCLSCHSMHDYAEPSDQIASDRAGDESCLQCHESLRGREAEHSHHDAGTAGSRCMNCHMPHTTYGLFVAMRSHRIDSPDLARAAGSGRPNACNLCHLDRTLAWTGEHLNQWYGQPRVALDEQRRTVAASVLWAVKGDAAQRAIAAWHMGWPAAQQASGRTWQGPYLAQLLADPYAVLRRVARRSITTLPGFDDFAFDYTAPPEVLQEKATEAALRWQRAHGAAPDRTGPELLLHADGRLDVEAYTRILAERDTRNLRIIE